MNSRPALATPRRLLAGALLCALLLTQALGLLHRVLHAHGPAPMQASHAWLVQGTAAPQERGFAALFAQHHDAQDCQVFDQLTQAHAPGFAIAAVAAEPMAEVRLAIFAAPDLAAQAVGYLARGPPSQA